MTDVYHFHSRLKTNTMATLYDYFLPEGVFNGIPQYVIAGGEWVAMEGCSEEEEEEWDDGCVQEEEEQVEEEEEEMDVEKEEEEEMDEGKEEEKEEEKKEEEEVKVLFVSRASQTVHLLCECPFCPM